MVAVHLRNVSKSFGSTGVVHDVTLDIESGELFFLLGPSGCGKTTCLRIVAGFYEPDGGEVLFDDRPMAGVPPHRRNTAMVFQQYALWPHLTIAQNVGYGLDIRHVAEAEKQQRIAEAIEAVHMTEHLAKYPNQLSGGQQQRIALARALVVQPDVLLFDEPLSNLDAKLRMEMRAEIRRLHRDSGVTAIYVTHDQVEALSMADRLAVMNEGRIEQVGTPREVYTAPANAFVAGFIGETNFLEGSVSAVSGSEVTVSTAVGSVRGQWLSARGAAPAVGASVRCSVRPESLIVTSAGEAQPPGHNSLPARVASAMYLGCQEEFMLALDAGGSGAPVAVKAVMHNPGRNVRETGHAVAVAFDPADVVVFSA